MERKASIFRSTTERPYFSEIRAFFPKFLASAKEVLATFNCSLCVRKGRPTMFRRHANGTILLALAAGVVLAVMTDWNSQLARHSSPLFASWTAHGVGTAISVFLVLLLPPRDKEQADISRDGWPLWSYLGGIPGAFTVLLAAITVNSVLGLAGTLALLLVGQMTFGALTDCFGFFRLQRRRPQVHEAVGYSFVLIGSVVIIMARS
jgi:transporter family-2 protein